MGILFFPIKTLEFVVGDIAHREPQPAADEGTTRMRYEAHESATENVSNALAALQRDFPIVTQIPMLVEQQQQAIQRRGQAVVTPRPTAESALGLALLATPLLAGAASTVASLIQSTAGDRLVRHDANSDTGNGSLTPTPSPAPELGAPVGIAANAEPFAPPLAPDRILQADWMNGLDLKAFDDIAFFRECGESIDDHASLGQRLAAAHRCFMPVLRPDRSALSLEGLDQRNRALFFRRLLPALDLGEAPQAGLDPTFGQILFQRWFLSLASPPSGDGNGGPDTFPLNDFLLKLTHATPATVATCADGAQGAALMRLDRVRDEIAARFAQEDPDQPRAVQEWIVAALLAVFEPTLVRHDRPPSLRHGSLEWALLDIGIRLAGAQHWQYSHQELIGLAVAADVFGAPDDAADGAHAVVRQAIGAVLRMAHAEGAIDLSDAGADAQAALETAIALFETRMDERRQSASLASFFAGLPVRRDTAGAMLKERGFNPEQRFTLVKPRGYGRDLQAAQTKELPGLDFDKPYALVDFFMSGCITQLLIYGRLPGKYANALQSKTAALSGAVLDARFKREFDAAFGVLSDSVFARALDAGVAAMDERDGHFWQCGKAAVRIPEANILTRIPPRANPSASGAGRPIISKNKDYPATGGLLVQLTLDQQGHSETRDYWVTPEPLAVARFDGDVAGLLSGKLEDFFKVDGAGEHLLKLNPETPIRYRHFANADAGCSAVQFVGRHLLAPSLPQAREIAFQMSGPELSRERLYQSLLDLLPLRACIQSYSRGESYRAAFFCGADALSLISILGAGVKVAGGVAGASAALSKAEARKVALSLLTGVVRSDIAPQTVATTLRVGAPLFNFGRQTARWLNPTDGMASGLSWLTVQMGRGSRLLLQRLQKISMLHRLSADVECSVARQQAFYPDRGFWRAAPDAVTVQNGQRQLQLDDKRYLVIDMGARKNVLALRDGRDLRLANPESGLPYGPALNRPAEAAGGPRSARYALRALCRSKRSGTDNMVCNAITRATRFGRGIYSFAGRVSFSGFQARVQGANLNRRNVGLLPVDLNDIGFASYTQQKRAGKFVLVYNSRYFAFDGVVWMAEGTQLRATSIACPFPDRLRATVIYSAKGRNARQESGTDYLAFDIKLPSIGGSSLVYFNKYVVPYGNYPGSNGECMGMIEIAGTAYKFSFADNWSVRPPAGARVTLKKATEQDYRVFAQYQGINADARTLFDTFEADSLRQLKAFDSATQRRFDAVFRRAEQLADAAGRALASGGLEVEAVLGRFLPSKWDAARKEIFIAALEQNLDKLRSALPMVKRDKLDVIGLGTAKRAEVKMLHGELLEGYARAEALTGSMVVDMHFTHANKALIYFDERHFRKAGIDALAGDLLHELSHARLRSLDTISAASSVPVYPSTSVFDRKTVDIAPLIMAAAQAGSDSVNNAATLEYLIVALAYTQAADTLPLLHSLFNGGTRFSHRPDVAEEACTENCALSR